MITKTIRTLSCIILLSSCSQPVVDMDEISDHIGLEAMEAPGLAKEVAEGRLPPLNERLPEKPSRRSNVYSY